MDVDKVIALLFGLGFGTRALDGKKGTLARIGYGLVGYDLLKTAMTGEGTLFGAQKSGLAKVGKNNLNFKERKVRTIAERVAYVHEQMVLGTRDPAVYALAREVVTRKCGDTWCIPEKDHKGEMVALFNEARSRCRYTLDPTDYDAFQTPGRTLELASGDCDDEVSLLGAMLRTIGIPVRSRIYQLQGADTWGHINLMAQDPGTGEWISLDLAAINKPAGYEVPKSFIVKQRDFDVLEKEVPKLSAALNAVT